MAKEQGTTETVHSLSDTSAKTPEQSQDRVDTAQTVGPTSARHVKGFRWICVVLSVLCSIVLYSMDSSLFANIRPSIVDDFGHVDLLPWVSVAYPIGSTTAVLIWGKLYTRFNNKTLYLTGILGFEIGSAISGSAKSMAILIFGRALAGVGGSGYYLGTTCIFSRLTTITERALYISYVGVAWCLGSILGPIIGGAFVDSAATWRWAFYLNVCVAGVTVPICIFLIPPIIPDSSRSVRAFIKHFDFLGASLFLAAILTINMILALGGSVYAWSSYKMTILFALAPATWLGFAVQQGFGILTVDKLFPVHLVKNHTAVSMFVWTAIIISGINATVFSLPLLFQLAHGTSPTQTAVLMLPYLVTLAVTTLSGARLFRKYPVCFVWYLSSGSVMLIGSTLLSTITHNTSKGMICGFSTILAFGTGALLLTGFAVAQAKVAKEDIQQVTAFLTIALALSSCLGIGISTCLVINLAMSRIAAIIPNTPRKDLYNVLTGATSTTLFGDLDSTTHERILDAIARSVGSVFYMIVAGSALGMVTAIFMRKERLVLK